MIAPVESVTRPDTAPNPASACPYALAEKTTSKNTNPKVRFIDFPLIKNIHPPRQDNGTT
jgi:hypothetical protein